MSVRDQLVRSGLAVLIADLLLLPGLRGPILWAWVLVPLLLLSCAWRYCPLYALLGVSTRRPWPE